VMRKIVFVVYHDEVRTVEMQKLDCYICSLKRELYLDC